MENNSNRNTLTMYRRHVKSCRKTEQTLFPNDAASRKADACECPINVHGYLIHVKGRIRHYSLDTCDWIVAGDRMNSMLKTGRLPNTTSAIVNPDDVTVDYAVKEFIDLCKSDGASTSAKTAQDYETFFTKRLIPFCTEYGVTHLKELENLKVLEDFQKTWKRLDGGKLDADTRKKFVSLMRTFYKYCIGHDWLVKNTAKFIGGTSAADVDDDGEDEERIGLELHEYQAVLNTLDAAYPDDVDTKRLRAIIELMRWTGMRISDAEKFSRTELVCNSSKTGCNANFIQWKLRKYGEKARCVVSVPDHVSKMIQELPYNSESNGKKFFFRAAHVSEGRRHWYNKIVNLFAKAQELYGAFAHHATPHNLRHTAAIQWLNAGEDIRDVSKWLGHRKVSTTIAHYSHETEKSKQDREERSRNAYQAQMAKTQNLVIMRKAG